MCGIAGILDVTGQAVDRAAVDRMVGVLPHRGPDDRGVWAVDHEGVSLGLGHARLSIIDLSVAARQPVSDEGGGVVAAVNGEIYNFRELRRELEGAGHVFRSRSDSEVVVHLYEERGLAFAEALRGMFAIALWDERNRRLVLARDRFGIKPLYVAASGGRWLFASEVKAILAGGWEAGLDPEGLAEHFAYQWTTGERTLFRGVRYLEPGTILVVEGGRERQERFATLVSRAGSYAGTLDEAAERLRGLFVQAVERQLVSDVPVGTFLSGGMDTGAISAVAARHIPTLHTFTCGFETGGTSDLERFFDERPESRALSRYLGTVHHERVLRPGDMERILPRVVWHLDEPRCGISYQVYRTAELIRQHVTVVLSGVGGDELFGGYPWRYRPVLEADDPAAFGSEYHRAWTRFFDDEGLRGFLSDGTLRDLGGFSTRASFDQVLHGIEAETNLDRALLFDMRTFLHGLLMVDDKLSMAHSVEARVPFLDEDVVDFALSVPASWKVAGDDWKIVLKRAMKGLLPEETFKRRKQGFTPPDESWYRLAPTGAYLEDLILAPRALDRGVFRPEALRRVFDEHASGRVNHRFLLWSLASMEWWHRLFVDGDPLPDDPGAATVDEGLAPAVEAR